MTCRLGTVPGCDNEKEGTNLMVRIRTVLTGAATAALLTLTTAPAQALTEDAPGSCGDSAEWDYRISNPARYNVDDHHAAVIGLADARRTVTIVAPPGCQFDEGDTWTIYNGYFTAEGTISAEEVAAADGEDGLQEDADSTFFEAPNTSSVAGDDIGVHLKVNNEVDKFSSVAPLHLLRRAYWRYNGDINRVNASPEPYTDGGTEHGTGQLVRVSWTLGKYIAYPDRHVSWQYRTAAQPFAAYTQAGHTIDARLTGSDGFARFADVIGNSDGPPAGDYLFFRGWYGGNSTTSGTYSTGDGVRFAG